MLPSAARMRRRAVFLATTRRGVRAAGPLLVVHLDRDPDRTDAQVGLVVGRSVGPAVVRNRVRRRLRHLLRARLDRLPAGSRLVVRANPAAAGVTGAELGRTLDGALDRALRREVVR